ncbi:MAG TPA: adenosine kinase, partial [Candidatus Synoicihabitans sp.]|nr:adenosine kinase [Candidatus Synoicihabitans sp.]
MSSAAPQFDLVGVGSPIMDLVAPVPEAFLRHVRGDKGCMVLVDADEMQQILAQLETPPATSTGGSAANTTLN